MKKQKIDFVISYENWQRELYGCTLLKLELERRGYTVKMDHFPVDNTLSPYRRQWAPKVVIYPFLYADGCVRQAISFGKRPENIINLQSEQILSDFTVQWRPKMPTGDAKYGYHVCWGEKTKERMSAAGVPESNLKVVGNIHLDIDREEYRNLFFTKEDWAKKYDLDVNKPWIMFFSNFKYARMNQEDIDEYIAWAPERLKGLAAKRFEEAPGECEGTLGILYDFIKRNPDVLIIYRYHPAEMKKEEELIKKMKEMPDSFRCINDGTIQDWIPACDMFLTTDSTSMTDVIMQKKPFGLIETREHNEAFWADTYRGATKIGSVNELENAVEAGRDYYPLADGIFEHSIVNTTEGKKAYEALADYAEEIYNKKAYRFRPKPEPRQLNMFMELRLAYRYVKDFVYRNPIKRLVIVPNLDNEAADTEKLDKLMKKMYCTHSVEKHRSQLEREKAYEERLRPFFEK
ncbi:MAG: hypothetical protein MJ107_01010 [Lachnospiraceae bacterium]|nr:hypothetical protein [Lachnospiraceae bacterium]